MTVPACERVVANLNRALGDLLASNERAYLLGQDITDPYGGAFKVTKGLSTRFPGRVLGTPISESAIVGVACGLALSGDIAISEVMFGDFLFLAFDQIANFAAKAVSMYGRQMSMRMVVRTAVGGRRGYGATHSQSPQKHFIGVPDLVLVELSPFHDNTAVFQYMVSLAQPCLFFEHKMLYGTTMYTDGAYGDIFSVEYPPECGAARVFIEDSAPEIDCVFITPGGTALSVLTVAQEAFLEREVNCQVIVPAQLYPLDLGPLKSVLGRARRLCVVEEGVAGGTWGEYAAHEIGRLLGRRLRDPVRLVHSRAQVIPSAPHLEDAVLVSERTIRSVVWPDK